MKKIGIQLAIITVSGAISGTIAYFGHVTTDFALSSIIGVSFFAGAIIGELEHKEKRDKEFARIVADRLLQKSVKPSGSIGAGLKTQ